MAAQLLTEIIAILITSLFLDHEFLFTPMILNFPVCLICLVTLLMIRPGSASEPSSNHEDEQDEQQDKTEGSIRHSIGVLSQILRDRNALVLLATVPVARLISPITDLMLQYIPRKFDVSLGSVSCYISKSSVHITLSLTNLGKQSAIIAGSRKLDLACDPFTNLEERGSGPISNYAYPSRPTHCSVWFLGHEPRLPNHGILPEFGRLHTWYAITLIHSTLLLMEV
jgi:hypothetical protein